MAGTKRDHDAMDSTNHHRTKDPSKLEKQKPMVNENDASSTKMTMATTPSSPYIPMFEYFRAELDEHHDRRERVLKASKDITANSKKIIFALQRVKTLGRPIADKRINADVTKLTTTINELFVAVGPDLTDLSSYRYQRNISGGLQEFMEAVLFKHYLETQAIMDYEQAQDCVPGHVMLTYEDYVLGLLDVTGELMRFAVTGLATRGMLPGIDAKSGAGNGSILADMQTLRSELERMDVGGSYALSKDFDSKLKVTRQSVEKVENGVYGMIVRGKERPPGWTPDLSGPVGIGRDGETVESY